MAFMEIQLESFNEIFDKVRIMLAIEGLEIFEVIGRGGMGEVYRGVLDIGSGLKKPVAVKVIKKSIADEPGFLDRFQGEVKTLLSLDHPNIARVLRAGNLPDGRPFYAMDLIEGRSLREILDSGERFQEEKILDWALSLKSALEHCHKRGVFHRDISPHNLILGESGQIYLIDFGVSKLNSNADGTLSVAGKPGYLSPGYLQTGKYTAQDDFYSLGLVMLEIVQGKPIDSSRGLNAHAKIEVAEGLSKLKSNRLRQVLSEALGVKATSRTSKPLIATLVTALVLSAGLYILRNFPQKDKTELSISDDPSPQFVALKTPGGKNIVWSRKPDGDLSNILSAAGGADKLYFGCGELYSAALNPIKASYLIDHLKRYKSFFDGRAGDVVLQMSASLKRTAEELPNLVKLCPTHFNHLSSNELNRIADHLKEAEYVSEDNIYKLNQKLLKDQHLKDFSKTAIIWVSRISKEDVEEMKTYGEILKVMNSNPTYALAEYYVKSFKNNGKRLSRETCLLYGEASFVSMYLGYLLDGKAEKDDWKFILFPSGLVRETIKKPNHIEIQLTSENDALIKNGVCIHYRKASGLAYSYYFGDL